MPKSFSEFLALMDERLWFRMIVCFLPGLLVIKLVGYSTVGSPINHVSTAVMLIGVALYVFWGRIRSLSGAGFENADEVSVDESDASHDPLQNAMSAEEQLEILAELRNLCQEKQSESDRLIALEAAVNPHLTYADATKTALARRKLAGE
jgi:hypothetical protein